MLQPRRDETDEYAVMIDARDPLEVGPLPAEVEIPDYANSWRGQPDVRAAE
jgi:homogentisate 1,2-dioxygenase